MLIILNIINGIIVDTFQALREQNNKKDDILNNFCYICSLERAEIEIKGINYEKHIMKDHFISNYLHYLIKIQGTDEHDLNSLDSEVLKAIKEFKTDFFPNKKAKALENV
jgi:inositol 1,4,5-triphosphate receptor type 1